MLNLIIILVDIKKIFFSDGQTVDKLQGEEAPSTEVSSSNLRMRNAKLMSDVDPKYRGKKVSRKDFNKNNEISYDPELAKMCMVEGESDDDDEVEEDEDVESEDEDNEVIENGDKNSINSEEENEISEYEDDENSIESEDDSHSPRQKRYYS